MENKESIMSKQRLINIIGGLMVLFAILPLMLNAGTLALLALGLLLLSVKFWSPKWRKRLMPFIALGLTLCLLYAVMYFLVESFTVFNLWLTLLRVVCSAMLTFVIVLAIAGFCNSGRR